MPKPNFFPKVQPKSLQETAFPSQEAVNLDPDAFDDAIRSQGLTFVHYRAMKCPIGVVDADDERHPHGDHGGCSNGFLYKVVGPLTCVPSNNSNSPQVQDMGILNQVNLMVTAPRFYDVLSTQGGPMRVLMAPYDRMYLSEESITVIQWQLFEACGGPTDKMDYPVAAVEHLVNAQGKELLEGCDFVVQDGLIRWVLPSADGPVPNPDAGTGGILSIRYCYRPYWYVRDLPHEIRVTQLENFEGVRQTERMNQQASLQREYIFENQANDKDSKDAPADNGAAKPETPLSRALGQSNLRQILAPRTGGFGPR